MYSILVRAILVLALLLNSSPSDPNRKVPKEDPAKASTAVIPVKLDLDLAKPVEIPAQASDLRAVPIRTADGRVGWAVRIPGNRPIATPAYADGMIFVGGGYGSHEFYAFDAQSGHMVWQMKTGDDGPTAAVVEDGYVVFNTESCTLLTVDAKTGKIIWQEWLGDPLMSQPAIYKGRIYMAYPGGQRNSRVKAGYRLLSLDLATGKHLWEVEIPSDVISAPVVADGKVYFTTLDGTSFSLDAFDGKVLWSKHNAGTSAPVIAEGNVVMSKKEMRQGKPSEGIVRLDPAQGKEKDHTALAVGSAEYLGENKGGGVALTKQATMTLDSSVGFSTAPPAAKLSDANKHIGVNSVVGGWAYQGSRAAVARGRMLNAQGRRINSVQSSDGKLLWQADVSGKDIASDAQVFSPPALGQQNMYLTSASGHIVSLRQSDGKLVFAYSLKHPMAFQPALAGGAVYAGTADGWLICLKTGDSDADGWYAWGGNAQHNR